MNNSLMIVIVVTKNRSKFLLPCVQSLLRGERGMYPTSQNMKILLYAEKSNDNTQREATELYFAGMVDDLVLEDTKTPTGSFLRGSLQASHYDWTHVLFTADDYLYAQGWNDKLMSFLDGAPQVSHVSCELEPLFPWNAPIGKITANGITGLSRATIPGANWAFTRSSWSRIKSDISALQLDPMWDHKINGMVTRLGWQVVALNLAEHVGALESSTGNKAFQVNAKPLPEEWKV